MNKNMWEYKYYTELIGGGYVDHIVIVTKSGRKTADLLYEKAIDDWCKDFNKNVFYYEFKRKQKVS
mgnify:CR=1 FL=1|tara:strand:- start:136 stop:333 length:198 start_codon:yes stop_codon:yes gene_type:complete